MLTDKAGAVLARLGIDVTSSSAGTSTRRPLLAGPASTGASAASTWPGSWAR